MRFDCRMQGLKVSALYMPNNYFSSVKKQGVIGRLEIYIVVLYI